MKHVMTNMEGKKIVIDKFPLLITEIGFINCIFLMPKSFLLLDILVTLWLAAFLHHSKLMRL